MEDSNAAMNNPPATTANDNLHMRISFHQKALQALNSERAQLIKHLETLKAERNVLEAVARKVATTRRPSTGTQ